MKRERYPELFQFFGGYFHQDWDIDAPTGDGVIDLFNRTHSMAERVHIADLIDAFDDALAEALFKDLGCYYLAEPDGVSQRSWLQHISRRLRETN